MEETTSPVPETCVTCGAKLRGKFCHKCGEKKVSRKDSALWKKI